MKIYGKYYQLNKKYALLLLLGLLELLYRTLQILSILKI
jgi:hypothetical protein